MRKKEEVEPLDAQGWKDAGRGCLATLAAAILLWLLLIFVAWCAQ